MLNITKINTTLSHSGLIRIFVTTKLSFRSFYENKLHYLSNSRLASFGIIFDFECSCSSHLALIYHHHRMQPHGLVELVPDLR